jgi:hypothetical protein
MQGTACFFPGLNFNCFFGVRGKNCGRKILISFISSLKGGEVCADEILHVPPITPSTEKRSICIGTGASASWDGHRGEDLLVVATPARSVIVRTLSS